MTSDSPVGPVSANVTAVPRSRPAPASASAIEVWRAPVTRTGTVSTNMPTGRSSSLVNRPDTGIDSTTSSESVNSARVAESATHRSVLTVVPLSRARADAASVTARSIRRLVWTAGPAVSPDAAGSPTGGSGSARRSGASRRNRVQKTSAAALFAVVVAVAVAGPDGRASRTSLNATASVSQTGSAPAARARTAWAKSSSTMCSDHSSTAM